MQVTVDGRTYEGRVVDLADVEVSAEAVLRAIRGDADGGVAVACPDPGAAHGHVGRLPPAAFDRRAALADAARALGHASSVRSTLAQARSELESLESPPVESRAARRRVAEAGEEEERLRERVAELRGRLQARRDVGADTATVEARLEAATRRLSEVETERIAAEQALDRAETAARDARDRRERRLKLQDRVANLERSARAELAAAVWERFRSSLDAVPGTATAGHEPGTYEGDAVTAALAVARLAPLDAPAVVGSLARFDDAETAAAVLDAPVVYTG